MAEKRQSVSREAVLVQLREIGELALAELRQRGVSEEKIQKLLGRVLM